MWMIASCVSFRKVSANAYSHRWSFSAVGKRKIRQEQMCFLVFISLSLEEVDISFG